MEVHAARWASGVPAQGLWEGAVTWDEGQELLPVPDKSRTRSLATSDASHKLPDGYMSQVLSLADDLSLRAGTLVLPHRPTDGRADPRMKAMVVG